MKNSELRILLRTYEEIIQDLLLRGKLKLEDIPYSQRKNTRNFYIASNRATRYDEAQHAEFVKLLFEDYEKMFKYEKPVLNCLVEWELQQNENIQKSKLQAPTTVK